VAEKPLAAKWLTDFCAELIRFRLVVNKREIAMNVLGRKFLLVLVLGIAGILSIVSLSGAQPPAGVEGRWEGTLDAGQVKLRLILDVEKPANGVRAGTLTSVDQGGVRIPVEQIELNGKLIRFDVKAVNGSFDGSMSEDKSRITGTWTQGVSLPLELVRVTASTVEKGK
jgi:hypothetical protein